MADMQLTKEQRDYLTHMLGAERHVATSRWGYRNYYCAGVGGQDERDLMALVDLGLVRRGHVINGGESVYFFATEQGMDAVGLTDAQKRNAQGE